MLVFLVLSSCIVHCESSLWSRNDSYKLTNALPLVNQPHHHHLALQQAELTHFCTVLSMT